MSKLQPQVRRLVQQLVKRRQESGVQQSEIADLLGSSKSRISFVETGATPDPKLSTVLAYCRVLGIEQLDLRDGDAR